MYDIHVRYYSNVIYEYTSYDIPVRYECTMLMYDTNGSLAEPSRAQKKAYMFLLQVTMNA